ncbi:biotin transporter BioY [Aquipuribacter hungaricus]|uniref:Biotin transporter n=1 Tax=Aquipuribacter hungaricus TaxID=545624 RepID=A0ABV7WF73_9MICO
MTPSPAPASHDDASDGLGTGAGAGRDVALVAVFAALVVVLALVPAVPVGAAGVPISLQTLGVMLAALVLGPWRGLAAVAVYVALGAAGLPVFAQGAAGLGVLAGPTAGYIFGWLPGSVVTGVVALLAVRRTRGRLPLLILAGALGGVVVTYLGGWLGLVLLAGLSPVEAVVAGVLPYLPGDGVKVVLAAFVAASVHRAFPDILVRRAAPAEPATAR